MVLSGIVDRVGRRLLARLVEKVANRPNVHSSVRKLKKTSDSKFDLYANPCGNARKRNSTRRDSVDLLLPSLPRLQAVSIFRPNARSDQILQEKPNAREKFS
ncbi:hypothetical protein KC344_g88 [Hortaea werneckii]|nr:hypothetical protein KC344_g88 [Hortaea werneckii]